MCRKRTVDKLIPLQPHKHVKMKSWTYLDTNSNPVLIPKKR